MLFHFNCSVYIEAIKCILGAIPHTYQSNSGETVQCTAVDTGPLMKESVKIFHEVASRSMGGMASFVLLDFTECDGMSKCPIKIKLFTVLVLWNSVPHARGL